MSAPVLRGYQRDLLAAVRRDHEAGERAVAVELPTGGGKGVCLAARAREVAQTGGRTLVTVHREEIVDQLIDHVQNALGPQARIGRVQGTVKQTTGVDAVVGMVQTLATPKGLDALAAGGFSYTIIDEAHHSAAPTYRRVIEATKAHPLLGVSATLARSDRLALGEVFSKISYVKPIVEMIREGWLVRPRGRHVFIEGLDLRGVRTRNGDFADGALAAAMKEALAPEAIVRAWQEHAKDRKRTIGFAPTVELAYLFAEAFRAAGVKSRAIHGDRSAQGLADRRAAVEAYRRGDIEVLWNVGILTEGFDVPETDCVVMARPTKSAVLFTQCVGRGLRLADGKTDCLVLDVVGVLGAHRLASLATLSGAATEEDIPDDLLAYEDDWDDAFGEEEPAAAASPLFMPEFVDGQLSWSEIELFEESAFAWLRTLAGNPFILHERNVIFPVVQRAGGVRLAMAPVTRPGGELSGEVYADIPEAMQACERWLSAADYVRRSESWRNTGRWTQAQEREAARWGVVLSDGMTRGDVSDAINVAMASQRIDHLPMLTEGI